MSGRVTIQGIDCWGTFEEDSNVLVCGYFKGGMEFEEVWTGDYEITTWTGAVKELKAWANRAGITIEEVSAC